MLRLAVLALLVAGCDEVDHASPLDQAPAPRDLTLEVSPLVAGGPVTITVSDALPNQTIFLFRAATASQNGFCPPQVAPDCLDLLPPVVNQMSLRSNGQGVATVTFTLPASVPGIPIAMQAAYINGNTIDTSNPILQDVNPPNSDRDGDGLTAIDEVTLYGTNPNLFDSDNGGTDDGDEIAAGTDPTDPSDDNPVDNRIRLIAEGVTQINGNQWSGTETWTWRGESSGTDYCVVRYDVIDQASYPGTPPGPAVASPCIPCDFFLTGVAYNRTELTPPGQCASFNLPIYPAFVSVYNFGYGLAPGDVFWEYLWADDLWVPSNNTVSTTNPATGDWSYDFEQLYPWVAP
jgi:hypothetical protein